MNGNSDVAGGSHFTVSMAAVSNGGAGNADPTGFGSADLYLSTNGSGTLFNLVSPDVAAAPISDSATPGPRCDLDTIHTLHSGRHLYRADPSTPDTDAGTDTSAGAFLRDIPYTGPTQTASTYEGNLDYGIPGADDEDVSLVNTGQGFEIVLRRRLNPNLPSLNRPDINNPWIEVDRVRVEFRDLFNIDDSNNPATAAAVWDNLRSEERREPLDSTDLDFTGHPAGQANNRYNTIAAVNDRAPANFTLYQPHFDRDFATTAELFQVPVVGPKMLTRRLNRMRFSPYQQVNPALDGAPAALDQTGDRDLSSSAVSMFLMPVFPTTDSTAQNNSANAWYRLLQYVEVPSRVNRMVGNYLLQKRVPGKLNLNGIRHIEVYAGLLDDAVLATVPLDTEFAPFMPDTLGLSGVSQVHNSATTVTDLSNGAGTFRDRWFDFVQERDGASVVYDPVSAANRVFWVPGTPNARPFRSLGHRALSATSGSGDSGLSETIFRTMATELALGDSDASTNRTLLELGNDAYHKNPSTVGSSASSNRERHQLTSKILNNTTTVSNAFIIYGTAAYFEATEDTSGLIRIGGRMGLDTDSDGTEDNDPGWEQRAVFVVDRTELLNAYDEGIGTFDWQRLIKYRADLSSDGQ
ncbi:MAG: hypothetical protein GY758_31625 [Fuerstiella sp.]|nr:hypothetical protein [Fuerstiella sp.]